MAQPAAKRSRRQRLETPKGKVRGLRPLNWMGSVGKNTQIRNRLANRLQFDRKKKMTDFQQRLKEVKARPDWRDYTALGDPRKEAVKIALILSISEIVWHAGFHAKQPHAEKKIKEMVEAIGTQKAFEILMNTRTELAENYPTGKKSYRVEEKREGGPYLWIDTHKEKLLKKLEEAYTEAIEKKSRSR